MEDKIRFRNIAVPKFLINMNFAVEKYKKYTIVKVKKDKLNDLISSDLKDVFLDLNDEGIRNIILDLSEVSHCDSSGLSAILSGSKLCKHANGSFVITNIRMNVHRIITISQLDKVLSMVKTNSEAADLIFMEEVEREFNNANEE